MHLGITDDKTGCVPYQFGNASRLHGSVAQETHPPAHEHKAYYSANMQYAMKYLGIKVHIKLTIKYRNACITPINKKQNQCSRRLLQTSKISNFKTSTVEETTVNMVILALIVVS
jgi:hypothetical protein